MQSTLALSAAFSVLSAGTFFMVGRAVMRRPVSPALALARNAFATWWFGLAAVTLTGAAQFGLVGFYQTHLPAYTTMTIVTVLGLCISLWGLLYYLLFLFTNKRGLRWPLAIAYAAYFVWLVYLTLAADIQGLQVERWSITPQYANPLEDTPTFPVIIAMLVGPQFIGALAYLTLYFQVQDPLQRRRILLVGLSILFWFGTAWAASIAQLGRQDWWQLTSRFIGLLAAGTIYYAYAHLRPRPGAPAVPASDAPGAEGSGPDPGIQRKVAGVQPLA